MPVEDAEFLLMYSSKIEAVIMGLKMRRNGFVQNYVQIIRARLLDNQEEKASP